MEATKWAGQSNKKGDTKDCFIFESCISPESSSEYVINIGSDMVGMFKIN